ncbi:prolipoprotein diacylglyceryl transferase [Ktedonosporobacter rubrisoli]|uniref:Phosphatidylglycerol--prolipoprotein diacylglyceryl transferase n=1 Tax=Ktedonosporobacter rubrisoli TaxID=2509675 RepID=A0A4P6JW93_KTERU|nr:prolipoprotein diacylglyceryl transferase [Ktedonosporobacter rubrisoli]QBD79834.1 prolipoprotein diacylglyceryl transferase [Ktedonosporobacter rubrisoli]
MGSFPLAYIYLNIDPVIVHLGPLALRWYGLMYVVGIVIGLWTIRKYTERKGINQDMVYRILWWCIAAGLIGGRLYFVVQQDNFFSYYLAQPWHIIATWEGGMAFYGAIFLVIATLIWRARVERINPLVLIDAGVLFAAAGQIFGRIGNIINGDIIGYPSTLPWSTVYLNPNSWACLNPETCRVPVQPAAAYELLTNIVVLCIMLYLARRVRRPGILMLFYLFAYTITQFVIFFVRANVVVTFLGLDWGLKQAQWTSIVVFIVLLPLTYWVLRMRYSRPVPVGEVAATYGIPQKPRPSVEAEATELDGQQADEEPGVGQEEAASTRQAEAQESPTAEEKKEPVSETGEDSEAKEESPEQKSDEEVTKPADA